MTYEEKRNWIYMAVTAVSYGIYTKIILGRAQEIPFAEVPYGMTMLWTILGAIVATIVFSILAGISSPKDAGKLDERDNSIRRYGEYIGYTVFSMGILGALILTVTKSAHFWIGNVIYLSFVVASIISSSMKLVAYRKGFQ